MSIFLIVLAVLILIAHFVQTASHREARRAYKWEQLHPQKCGHCHAARQRGETPNPHMGCKEGKTLICKTGNWLDQKMIDSSKPIHSGWEVF